MELYTFTDPESGVSYTVKETDAILLGSTTHDRLTKAVVLELLRVVEERDRLAAWKREAGVHIAADGARIRELEAEAERLEVLDRDRIAALEAENARLRENLAGWGSFSERMRDALERLGWAVAAVPPQQGSPAAGDEGAAGEGEQEPYEPDRPGGEE